MSNFIFKTAIGNSLGEGYNISYSYDANGKLVARYFYDGLNRLVRQDDINFGTVICKYDHAGNITCKTTYALTFDETLGTPVETREYTYRQRGWQDQLVTLNGQSFEYDAVGSPTLYCSKAMTWQGRRLLSCNGSTFTYDVDGMRTTMAANNVNIVYYYDNGDLVAERRTTDRTAHLPGKVQITLCSGKGKAPSMLLSADKTVSSSAIGKVNGLRDA